MEQNKSIWTLAKELLLSPLVWWEERVAEHSELMRLVREAAEEADCSAILAELGAPSVEREVIQFVADGHLQGDLAVLALLRERDASADEQWFSVEVYCWRQRRLVHWRKVGDRLAMVKLERVQLGLPSVAYAFVEIIEDGQPSRRHFDMINVLE